LTFQQLKKSAREGCERCSLLKDGVEKCISVSKISDLGCLGFKGRGIEHAWSHVSWVPENDGFWNAIEFRLFTLPGDLSQAFAEIEVLTMYNF
jgi:hypothetical protein